MAEYFFKEWYNDLTPENVINNATCLRWQAGLDLCGEHWTGAFEDGVDSITDDEFNSLENLIHDALPSFSVKTFTGDGQHVPGTDEWNRIERGIRDAIAVVNPLAAMDGTADGYKSVMEAWFSAKGATSSSDADTITALCDEWYEVTRADWTGYTEAPQPDEGDSFSKGGDNEGMEVTPSTDTEANQDDYAGNPLFAVVDCNFVVDADTLNPKITAIDGIAGNFKRTDPDTYVGVLQQSGYIFGKETSSTYLYGISANEVSGYDFCRPLANSLNADGTRREWCVTGKYQTCSNTAGSLNSYSGGKPQGYLSHNLVRTAKNVNGSQYSGYTSSDHEFILLMVWMKYGLTLDGIMTGATSTINYQYAAAVSETGVKRVLVTTTQGGNLEVGMVCLIGNGTDRASNYEISSNTGATITSIESVTVSGSTYSAVYFDTDSTFDTEAGSTYISTFRWVTGCTDNVLGNDGAMTSPASGQYPYKLQGIEMQNGGYDLVGDTILTFETVDDQVYYRPNICDKAANQSTSVTANYKQVDITVPHTVYSAWNYIKRNKFVDGFVFPSELGGSSSTFTRDAMYQAASGTTSAREMAVRGNLYNASTGTGASAFLANVAVSTASWGYGSRLSANGNRG